MDEVEKAHPDVMHMLLQILEEGRLTDSLGRHVDFRNTVVILTSNLGFDYEKQGQGLGFARETETDEYDRLRDRMINTAKQVFKPELLNRFDDVIVFRKLAKADVVQILDIELAKVRQRLEAKSIRLELDDLATGFLVDKGFDAALGARPLRRAVERFLEDPLAEELLRGILTEGVIDVSLGEDKQGLVFRMRGELPLRTPHPEPSSVDTSPKKPLSKHGTKKPVKKRTKPS